MNIITCKKLNKTYRRYQRSAGMLGSLSSLFYRKYIDIPAVEDFDMEISSGEFVGLIGPNGAGKTTIIKMLTGILRPTRGEIDVMGYYPNHLKRDFTRQYAVVMGQKSQLFFELTPADMFRLFKQLYRVTDDEHQKNVEYFINLFNVSDLVNVQVRTMSLGERMKFELIIALLHNPRVLFLDEPTIGLDAVAQRQMRGFLRDVNRERGTTVLLTSHYIEDIISLCPRCIVINGGKKIYDGDSKRLFSKYQTHRIISAQYSQPRDREAPAGTICMESSPYMLKLMCPHDITRTALRTLTDDGALADISVEEEDIGVIVERIYGMRREDEYA